MLSKEYHVYLQSEHWAQLKKEAFNRYGRQCQYCWSSNHIDVHHIRYPKPLSDATTNDVLPLCRPCHDEVHRLLQSARSKRCPREQAEVIIGEHLKDPQALQSIRIAKAQARYELDLEVKVRKQQELHIRKPRWTSRMEEHLANLNKSKSIEFV